MQYKHSCCRLFIDIVFLILEFSRNYPEASINTRSTYEIPHLNYVELEAGRTFPVQQTEEQREAFILANELTDEVLAASHIVIATPMYNWGK